MIRIITDSAADIDLQEAQKLQITILPMQIQFGEQSFLDRYEITADAFYQKLIETDTLPSTSQINPYTFEEEFEKVNASGDSAIVILVGADLSGTYQNAHLAAADYDNIYVIDSRNVTVGEQCLVRLAVLLRDKGKNAAEIADILDEKKEKVTILALLDTLEYLKKGGRISAAAAAISLLDTEPKVLPLAPALMDSVTEAASNFAASSFAAANCCAAIFSALAFCSFKSFKFFGVASTPSFFGKIKLRA